MQQEFTLHPCQVVTTGYMTELAEKRILLGLTGGIAAYKAADLARELIKQGADVKELEVYDTATQDGKPVFRYMKAIPTQKPCLTCHGPNVSEPLGKTIAEFYPDDQATGFSLGELRGAFTIVQPLQ